MAQVQFTLEMEFLTALFEESPDKAFGKLMQQLLNQVLLAESEQQLGAGNYERTRERTDYRNGTRPRTLTTRIGKLELEVPRHRNTPFETVLFEQYQRNEQALILTMIEMVVQGVSTRSVQKVTEQLCDQTFSKSAVSGMCRKLDGPVREFRYRLLPGKYPFVMVDAMYVKVREDHRVVSKALYVALGINEQGKKEILGFDVAGAESEPNWREFLTGLKERGLHGVDLVTSDAHKGLVKALKEVFPEVVWQRCQVHLQRNILEKTPKKHMAGLAGELRSMFQASTLEEARKLRNEICQEYEDVAKEAMEILDQGFEDAMGVMHLPLKYRVTLRSTNLLERENRELRRREAVIQIFPNRESAIRLMGGVLMDDHRDFSLQSRCFSMTEYFGKRELILPKMRKAV